MKKIILVRYGEIILKGLNRPFFENKLIRNIQKNIQELGCTSVFKAQARIFVEPQDDDFDFDAAVNKIIKVFGVVSVSIVQKFELDFNKIQENSLQLVKEYVQRTGKQKFKVETKRGNKQFPMESPEICREVGGYLLENIPTLIVDVINPEFTLYVEIREWAYVYTEVIPAFGGMPIGTNGKATLLLSGGIDSPVAGWMIAKRGVEINAVHFYSYPYTSERAKEKVIELTKIMSKFCGRIHLHVVPFTDIQLEINDKCNQEFLTLIMRRIMMIISEKIALKTGSQALITGESIGQVASQTMWSLEVTDSVVNMPVFRPLIGMDKNEVINIARKIETFETSILPYEDCCTVFVAKHPSTKPKIEKILEEEKKLNLDDLIEIAMKNYEVLKIESN